MTLEVPPFRLDFRSTHGRVFARLREDERDIAVHEWTSWLRIRSDVTGFVPPAGDPDEDDYTGFVPPVFEQDGLAMLVVARPQQDFTGQAIGLFHARLERDELERLRGAVESTRWAELPRPTGGHITAPSLELRHERGNLLIERRFNARSGNFIEAIGPLLELIEACIARANKAATSTLELGVDVQCAEHEPRRASVRVTLRNRGIGGIVLNDPRIPGRLEVRVGELSSPVVGVEPRAWTILEPPPPPADAPSSLIIPANRRFTLDLPWLAPRPGRYLVRVKWHDYAGPLEPVPGQIPFMPLPERGRSYLGSGAYPLRGANLASRRFEIMDTGS